MFIAMNRFKVKEGQGAAFEEMWVTRDSYLASVPGFIQFALLKGDLPGEYVSHSTWDAREHFEAWTKSESFQKAHQSRPAAQAVLDEHPHAAFYEAVLVEGR